MNFQQALAAADGSQARDIEASCQLHLAHAYTHLRDLPKATRALRRGIAVDRDGGYRRWKAVRLADLGTMLAVAGHHQIARETLRCALSVLTECADPRAEKVKAELASLPESS